MMRTALAILVALVMAGCGPARPQMPRGASHALAGKPLPTFRRPALSGAVVDTGSTKGSVVVVKFFAKYCEPCKRTLPAAQKLHEELPDVTMIGVAEDESVADVESTVAEYGLTFPVVHDRANVLSGRFRVAELPITFVGDRSGTIEWIGSSSQDENALGDAVRALR